MTYKELGVFGFIRKVQRCGPVGMFLKLLQLWDHLNPAEIAAKVSTVGMYLTLLLMDRPKFWNSYYIIATAPGQLCCCSSTNNHIPANQP